MEICQEARFTNTQAIHKAEKKNISKSGVFDMNSQFNSFIMVFI